MLGLHLEGNLAHAQGGTQRCEDAISMGADGFEFGGVCLVWYCGNLW
jgi:hypothetical protein